MALIRHNGRLRGLWGLILVPSNLAFGTFLSYHIVTKDDVHGPFYWIMIGVMVMDLLLDLCSTRKHKMEVLTEFKDTLPHYAKGWMIPDILAAIPFDYLAAHYSWDDGWTFALRLLPLSKTFKVSGVLHDLQHILQMPRAIVQMKGLLYWGVQAVHAIALGWWAVGAAQTEIETTPAKKGWVWKEDKFEEVVITEPEVRKLSDWDVYLRSVYWTVTTVTTIGYGDYSPSKDNNAQIYFTILAQVLGVAFYAYVVGNIPVLIANANAARAAFDSRNEVIGEFMRIKQLPLAMQERVRDYYQYLWESRKNVSDAEVLGTLPHALSVDVLVFLNNDILQKVEFFQGVKEIFIREVVGMLTTEAFTPGDYIIREGEYGTCMYFLTNGAAEVVINGNTVATLGTGSPFGEMALVSGDKRNASIRAKTYCDVYVLQRASFDQLRSRYEDFDKRVVEITEKRAAANRKAQEERARKAQEEAAKLASGPEKPPEQSA
jgi:voltage-gated potassium channel